MKEHGGENRLLHAIDLALASDWSEAKALAESIDNPIADRLFLLLSDIEEREAARTFQLANIRHEIGNALSIAQANLEAIIDGLLEPTEARLNALLAALGSASSMLDELRRPAQTNDENIVRIETFNLCALISAHVAGLARLAAAKDVQLTYACDTNNPQTATYRGDGAHVGRILRNVLVNAVRYTPPGGTVAVRCSAVDARVRLEIKDHLSHSNVAVLNKMLRVIGGEAHIDRHEGNGENLMTVTLPLEPVHP
ncbi:MAG: hypothetical protein JO322_14665 [Candidatus Eremiobacteraeota bacterium]|nr:hypothetical protein [Candidatus Eremiobacteraeota bacterium]